MTSLEFDPGDLPALKARLAGLPDGAALAPIGIREIVIAGDGVEQLPAVLRRLGVASGTVRLVRDGVAKRRGRDDANAVVEQTLRSAGFAVDTLVLTPADDGLVHADLAQVAVVLAAVAGGAAAVVALGSGSVVDICKEACRQVEAGGGGRPVLVLVPTANSVTAYGSNLAVLFKDGAKRSFPGRFPDAVVCDLPTLASAPPRLTWAGLADCCARFVSYGDWYLSHELGLVERYSEAPLALMGVDLDRLYLAQAGEMGRATEAGTALLTRQLLLAGLAQSIVNISAPLSGTEHVVSHLLDMGAHAWGRPLAAHGAQVGVATIIAAAAYEAWLATFDPARPPGRPDAAVLREHIAATFRPLDPTGDLVAEIWRDYSVKLAQWSGEATRRRYADICRRWPEVSAEVRRLVRPAATVARMLALAGAPRRFEDLEPPIPPSEYRFALLNAHFIRARFTISDLLYWQGSWDAATVDRLLARAYSLT